MRSTIALVSWSALSLWITAIESGPAIGTKVTPLEVQIVEQGRAAEATDLRKQRQDAPTIYVFLDGERFDRPTASYLREVDAAVQTLQRREPLSGAVVVWLAADPAAAVQRIGQIQNSALKLPTVTWTSFPGPVAGPDGWAISDRARITAIVVDKGEVRAAFAYDSVNATDSPALKAVIDKLRAP